MFELHPQLNKDTFIIGEFQLCRILMMNDRQFPWLILVPKIPFIREIYELNKDDKVTLCNESAALSELLMNHFAGDKLNIGALGNLVPQLHIHHIVRFTHDKVWPRPVWGQITPKHYTKTQKQKIIASLQVALKKNIPGFIPC
jgi:diadenosine tetraphosphate (Ap4A) HIT family hydrolase